MKKNRFPKGWDDARIRNLASYYEKQSDDEAMAEDEGGTRRSAAARRVNVPPGVEFIVRREIQERLKRAQAAAKIEITKALGV